MARKTGLTGVEPSTMTVPKMDRVSVTFALALDSFRIENREMMTEFDPVLACIHCGEHICTVDDGDTMRVLFNTALAHSC
jgi:hypothetical protein